MKVGLYSVTYLGIWYRGRALELPEVVQRAVDYGYDGIEIDGKRPHGNPMDWTDRARRDFRSLCTDHGVEIVGVAGNNDFSSLVPEQREAQLLMVREQVRLCRDLGGRCVRLFFAWPGVTRDAQGLASYEQARTWWNDQHRCVSRSILWENVRETLQEAARIAADAGVTLALQNHTPLLRHYRDMLDMIREVDAPALQASLDVPILERQDDDYVRQAVVETGRLQALSHFGGEFDPTAGGAERRHYEFDRPVPNYPTFVRALRDVGYDGYLSFEFCHQALDARHRLQGIELVDEQARLAARYMRDLLVEIGAYTGTRALAAARS